MICMPELTMVALSRSRDILTAIIIDLQDICSQKHIGQCSRIDQDETDVQKEGRSTYRVLSIRCMCEVEKIYKALHVAFNQTFLCRGNVREKELVHPLPDLWVTAAIASPFGPAHTNRNQGRQRADKIYE
jgi:hypothetical protein